MALRQARCSMRCRWFSLALLCQLSAAVPASLASFLPGSKLVLYCNLRATISFSPFAQHLNAHRESHAGRLRTSLGSPGSPGTLQGPLPLCQLTSSCCFYWIVWGAQAILMLWFRSSTPGPHRHNFALWLCNSV